MRRYRITHRTTYGYSDSVSSSYGRGYLTPRELPGQRVLETGVTVTPQPTDQSSGHDVYGNDNIFFHVTTAHKELVVTGESTVEVDAPTPPADLLSAPWESIRPTASSPDGAIAYEFSLDLHPPEITAAVREYADSIFVGGRSVDEVITDLTHRIYTDFTYKSGSTTVSTRVDEVLRDRTGVCQDFARMAIACLRSRGLAARYVSGYLATDPPPGKERMVGVDATHAWAAVWLTGDTWLAFDPTNDQRADERYITVAWGRDYADVPPLRGVIYTDSKKSTIAVSVDVAPLINR
ncbi:transglutaminase family protein [Antrihabitans sp. YC3-6]|uniref:Transglutaminase family protein n=1 Tax=Antrihabitans stalagmiti TaxID=2799499 RepID=A0A934NNI2_9NOCA|nr:transglutaminase family protein [Antrihabitans stalagmiti]MBJ8338449.1 transglutaminase family protein [Antrihabitans stalagmiti]